MSIELFSQYHQVFWHHYRLWQYSNDELLTWNHQNSSSFTTFLCQELFNSFAFLLQLWAYLFMNVDSSTYLICDDLLKSLIKTSFKILVDQNYLLFSCKWIFINSGSLEIKIEDKGKTGEECEPCEHATVELCVKGLDEWRGDTKGLKFPFVF